MVRNSNIEKGVLTIEATISLSLFMFVIIILLSIINIFTVQARMQVALNTTAKQISQYSYIYSLVVNGMHSDAEKGGEPVDNIDKNLGQIVSEIKNLGGNVSESGLSAVLDYDYSAIKSSVDSTASSFEAIVDDPTILVYYLANQGMNLIQDVLIERITPLLMKGNLRTTKDKNSTETFLKQARVIEGSDGTRFGGLDFSDSQFFTDGSYDIKLSVKYGIKIIPLIPVDIEYHFSQVAYTEGWHVDNSLYKDAKNSPGTQNGNAKENKDKDKDKDKETIENTEGFWGKGVHELIRSEAIKYYLGEGYDKTSGLSNAQLYNVKTNDLLYISTKNPFIIPNHKEPPEYYDTVDDIPDSDIKDSLQGLIDSLNLTCTESSRVTIENGAIIDFGNNHPNGHLVVVIPEDPGLWEKYMAIIDQLDLKGVDLEIEQGYGLGAKTIEVPEGE